MKNQNFSATNNQEFEEVAKTLIRRDFELNRIKEKQESDLVELDRIAKMLVRRDLELNRIKEKQESDLVELDRIAKMLVRRDLEISRLQEQREAELREIEANASDLEETKAALMNILDDVEEERKKAEAERDKTLIIIKNFADGLLLIELGTIVLFNPQASEFFALAEGEAVGKKVNQFVGQPLGNILELTQKKDRQVFRQEFTINDNLILEVSIVCVGGANLCSGGQLVILHDITREKVIERLKTEFVSIAAHQLRTPLSAIKWTLSMLAGGEVGKITNDQKELLDKTYRSNERMIGLVNDLLNTARIEEGKFLAKLIKHDFIKIVNEIVIPFGKEVEKKGLLFEYQKPAEAAPSVEVDAEKISLAIQNILDNSLHYTKTGGIKVSLTFDKQPNEFLLTVADSGMGISQKEQLRIFSKFFRASSAVKMETEGSGLGLFIAKNIVEAHGGKIWFESEEGKGTTLYFTLPAGGLAGKRFK